jgi:hypothetical protein
MGYLGNWIATDSSSFQKYQSIARNGLGLDTIGLIISGPVVLFFGVRSVRWGVSQLVHAPKTIRSKGSSEETVGITPRKYVSGGLRFSVATIVLLAALLTMVAELFLIPCAYHLGGVLPNWIPSNWFNYLPYYCLKAYINSFNPWNIFSMYAYPYLLAFLGEAIRLFVLDLRNIIGCLRIRSNKV